MKNKEKYIDKIAKVACAWHRSFGVDKDTGKVGVCSDITCSGCKFDDDDRECERCRLEWLEQEYIEHPVISKRDRDFLGYLLEDYKWQGMKMKHYMYIVRFQLGVNPMTFGLLAVLALHVRFLGLILSSLWLNGVTRNLGALQIC